MPGELRPPDARLSKVAAPFLRTQAEPAIIHSSNRSPRRSLGLLVSHKRGVGIETSAHLQSRTAERVLDDGDQLGVVECGPFLTGVLGLDCATS